MPPSDLHIELQHRALRWLTGKTSYHHGAIEVKMAPGYVADAVAIGRFQSRIKDEYWRNHHKYVLRINHALMWRERIEESIFVFEAKATRADFLSTFKSRYGLHENRFSPVGSHHWIVVARGILTPEDITAMRLKFWGVLEQSGSGLREIHSPFWCLIDRQQILETAYKILRKG